MSEPSILAECLGLLALPVLLAVALLVSGLAWEILAGILGGILYRIQEAIDAARLRAWYRRNQ